MKILVTLLGRYGDMILTTPLFRILGENIKDLQLDVIAGRHNYSIIKNNPYINNLFIFDKSPSKLIPFIWKLRKNRYDYYFDPKDHYSSESKYLCRLIKARNKIGAQKKCFDKAITKMEENSGIHFSDIALQALKYISIPLPGKTPLPDLYQNEESKKKALEFVKGKEDFIVVNISASNNSKMWINEKWIEFLNSIKEDVKNIVLVFSPEHEELAKEIESKTGFVHLYYSGSINDVISVVHYSRAVVTVDTAVVHIAAAWDKPVLALYKNIPFYRDRFLPLSTSQIILQSETEDAPAGTIPLQEVLDSWQKFIKLIN